MRSRKVTMLCRADARLTPRDAKPPREILATLRPFVSFGPLRLLHPLRLPIASRMPQADVARHRGHLQAPRSLAKLPASRVARAVSLRANLDREVSLDRTAEARHIDVSIKAAWKHHAYVAAHRVEFHVVGAVKPIDLDFDVAAHRRRADRPGYVRDMNVAADRRSIQPARHSSHSNIAADGRDVIKVVLHRTRNLHLEENARVAVAVLGIMYADVYVGSAAAVFDFNLIAVSPFFGALNHDRITVVAGYYHIARYVADSDLAACADPVGFLKVLSGSGSSQCKSDQGRRNRKSNQFSVHCAGTPPKHFHYGYAQ